MTTLSMHVLDAALGVPAAGLVLQLDGPGGALLERAATDDDGRARFTTDVDGGTYAIVLATGPWFAAADRETFYPSVTLTFAVVAGDRHHHVALLLSPFAYTTYRGS